MLQFLNIVFMVLIIHSLYHWQNEKIQPLRAAILLHYILHWLVNLKQN